MRHFIIVKFKKETGKEEIARMTEPVRELFRPLTEMPGIHGVSVSRNVVDRDNRYDLAIEIDMDREALEAYDASEPHREWKARYGELIDKKTIIDLP